MIVVDNFRTVLLVGLICTVWISPSFADNMCKGTPDTCATADDKYCLIKEDGTEGGCKPEGDCPAGVQATGFVCEAGKGCCCTAGATACNDMKDDAIKMKACEDALIKDTDACKMAPSVTGPTTSSSEGPTDGGGPTPAPAGGLVCKLNETVKETCSAGKACRAKKDGSEVKCVEASECSEDGCKDDVCCCKMAEDATTACEIPSSGPVIFGSFQVVTLVATALYFFPTKTSS